MTELPKDLILRIAKNAVSVDGTRLAMCVREQIEEDRQRREEAKREFLTDEQQRERAAFLEAVKRSPFGPMLRSPQSDEDFERSEKEESLVADTLEKLGVSIHPLTYTVSSLATSPLLSEARDEGFDTQEVAELVLMWITEQSAAQIADLLTGGNRDELMIDAPEEATDWQVTIEPIDDVLREEIGVRKRAL